MERKVLTGSRGPPCVFVEQLVKASGRKVPKDADLEAAFVLADEDEGGTVDLDEFLNLYAAVIAGEVAGLASKGFEGKEKFKAGMKDRAGAAQRRAVEDEARRAKLHLKHLGNATEFELARNREKHGRLHTSSALTLAREEFENRDRATMAQDIGHLGLETAASKHRHDAVTASNTSAAEFGANMQLHMRKQTGDLLTQAGKDYGARDHSTVAQDVGHLGTETKASLHAHDAMTADNTSAAEFANDMQVHMRKQTGDLLTQAGKDYDARDHSTVAQDVGHLGHQTSAGIHQHDERTADNTPEAEWMNYVLTHSRLLDSAELTKAKAEWDARRAAGVKAETKRFEMIDTDNSGSLDLEEILAAAPMLNLTAAEARQLFIDLDTDGSGDIDKTEFMAHYKNHTKTKAYGNAAKETSSSANHKDRVRKIVPLLLPAWRLFFKPYQPLSLFAAPTRAPVCLPPSLPPSFPPSPFPQFKSAIDLKREADAAQREGMAQTLADAKTEWQRRRNKSKFSFTVSEAPAASASTLSSASRNNGTVGAVAKTDMLRQTVHGRKAMTEALNEGRREYAKRMAKAAGKPYVEPSATVSTSAVAGWGAVSEESAGRAARKADAALSGGRAVLDRAAAADLARSKARERAREEVRRAKAEAVAAKAAAAKKGPLWFVPGPFAYWRGDFDKDGKKAVVKGKPTLAVAGDRARAEKAFVVVERAVSTIEKVEAAQRNLAIIKEAREERLRGASLPRDTEALGAAVARARDARGRGESLTRSIDIAAVGASVAATEEVKEEVKEEARPRLADKHATSYAKVDKRVRTALPPTKHAAGKAAAGKPAADKPIAGKAPSPVPGKVLSEAAQLQASAEEAEALAKVVAARAAAARTKAAEARALIAVGIKPGTPKRTPPGTQKDLLSPGVFGDASLERISNLKLGTAI